ncbi:M20/M25/M40 family metallo-hydrolase [Canibacter zhoujuaniae]|uniref:M20/M25/M40 family metallo-hydrolase n=1 Tax=Canibacter zhoujuaniae TaxID=2708343 RepID=UPI0014241973|nr:M20/M25/M40 family metallo-hydrolase [Canibacter zhoujuaniae]
MIADPLDTTVTLLQDLIRAACVNDGADQAGQEIRAVRVLQDFLAGSDAEIEVYEALPGRGSLVARVKGTDPNAPKVGMLGHLDVVPVEREAWERDPFGGDLIDGEVWGRGAVDMLFLTASFATVLREVALAAKDGRPPRGDLLLIAVADEEAGGERGIKWLLQNAPIMREVTEIIGESGGMRFGNHLAIEVGEKGSAGRKIKVKGVPAHASIPFGSNGAVSVLAEAERLLREAKAPVVLGETWQAFVTARVSDETVAEKLRHPSTVAEGIAQLGVIAGYAHAISRTTFAPTKVSAGSAHNVIPASGTLTLDIRTLPGVNDAAVDEILRDTLAPLGADFEIKHLLGWAATQSPTDSDLFQVLSEVATEVSGAPTIPLLAAGGSDCRFYRELGIPAYGFAVLSPQWTYEQYRERIHAHNERIDVESINLTLTALRAAVGRRIG